MTDRAPKFWIDVASKEHVEIIADGMLGSNLLYL